MKNSATLKSLAAALVLGGSSLFIGGCANDGLRPDLLAPPAYTTGENAQREFRYAAYDWSQAIEDIDKDVLMTRPSSRLTNWNVRESD